MSAQKGYCEDITEGKFSFPISHAMWIDDPRKAEILRILKSKTTDDQVKAHVVQCLEESGSFEYTRQTMRDLYVRARSLLDSIPRQNPAVEALVEKLMEGMKTTSR
jgi:geranylgeranyl diphosphate synthase type 3